MYCNTSAPPSPLPTQPQNLSFKYTVGLSQRERVQGKWVCIVVRLRNNVPRKTEIRHTSRWIPEDVQVGSGRNLQPVRRRRTVRVSTTAGADEPQGRSVSSCRLLILRALANSTSDIFAFPPTTTVFPGLCPRVRIPPGFDRDVSRGVLCRSLWRSLIEPGDLEAPS